ncbi:MAG: hypothetical protein AAF658_15800 [Myxococcota bacterium]
MSKLDHLDSLVSQDRGVRQIVADSGRAIAVRAMFDGAPANESFAFVSFSAEGRPLAIRDFSVQGEVTVRGETLPDFTATRFEVLFDNGVQAQRVAGGVTGAGTFAARVFAGTYSVELLGFAPSLPPVQTLAEEWVAVPAAQTYDLLVQNVALGLTVDGVALSDGDGTGRFIFNSSDEDEFSVELPLAGEPVARAGLAPGTYSVPLPETGPAIVSISFLPGVYSVLHGCDSVADCDQALALPPGSLLANGVALE